jgi:riboflavin kinase/FMN adenylyltransferase
VRVVPWAELLAGRQRINDRVRLSVGVFDGLHVGHRALLEEIVRAPGPGVALVVTFPRNPLQVLAPARFPGLILSYQQKLSRLSELGVDLVVVIDFSDEMSNLSGKAFISLLRENLDIEKIVVGENFRFGRSREAGAGDLKEMLFDTGIEVQVSQPVLRDNAVVSSSRIRKSIQEADFAEARAMLLADYSLDLRGAAGRRWGAGTTLFERSEIEQVLPAPGRYKVQCDHDGRLCNAELEILEDAFLLSCGCHLRETTVTFH